MSSISGRALNQPGNPEKDIHKVCCNEVNEAKQSAERDIQVLTAELTAFQQKRQRMQSRINKLNGEHDRITDANARALGKAQRKAIERAAKEAERVKAGIVYMERLDTLGFQIKDVQQTLGGLSAAIRPMREN
jgi:ubiquitination network signaling protein AcrB